MNRPHFPFFPLVYQKVMNTTQGSIRFIVYLITLGLQFLLLKVFTFIIAIIIEYLAVIYRSFAQCIDILFFLGVVIATKTVVAVIVLT